MTDPLADCVHGSPMCVRCLKDRLANPQVDKPVNSAANVVVIDPYEVFAYAVGQTYAEAEKVLLKKHRDYGPKNISLSPGGPLNGLRVRMWDKLARINNLIDSGIEPENESLRDSFLDLGNYCMIALLVLDGDWPSE